MFDTAIITHRHEDKHLSPLQVAQCWGSHSGERFACNPRTLCQLSCSFPICAWADVLVSNDQRRYNILRGCKWNHNPNGHWSQLCLELDCEESAPVIMLNWIKYIIKWNTCRCRARLRSQCCSNRYLVRYHPHQTTAPLVCTWGWARKAQAEFSLWESSW